MPATLSKLRAYARCGYECFCSSPGDYGSSEKHVGLVCNSGFTWQHCVGIFGDWERFACQGGFVNFQSVRLPKVWRRLEHAAPPSKAKCRLEPSNGCLHFDWLPIPEHQGGGWRQLPQRGNGAFSSVFVPDFCQDKDDDYYDDCYGVS